MSLHKVFAGAVSGFAAAFVIDLHAWTRTPGKFDWSLAFKRWVAGSITGVMAAAGIVAAS